MSRGKTTDLPELAPLHCQGSVPMAPMEPHYASFSPSFPPCRDGIGGYWTASRQGRRGGGVPGNHACGDWNWLVARGIEFRQCVAGGGSNTIFGGRNDRARESVAGSHGLPGDRGAGSRSASSEWRREGSDLRLWGGYEPAGVGSDDDEWARAGRAAWSGDFQSRGVDARVVCGGGEPDGGRMGRWDLQWRGTHRSGLRGVE